MISYKNPGKYFEKYVHLSLGKVLGKDLIRTKSPENEVYEALV